LSEFYEPPQTAISNMPITALISPIAITTNLIFPNGSVIFPQRTIATGIAKNSEKAALPQIL